MEPLVIPEMVAGQPPPSLTVPTASLWIPPATCSSRTSRTTRIREVDQATGKISTVAGNRSFGYSGDGTKAKSSELANPEGVAVDAFGMSCTLPTQNERIRVVSPATGVISTVAGNGLTGYAGDGGPATAASLNHPSAVAVDAHGDLFIVDPYSSVVREVTPAGKIFTVAGNGTVGYSGDRGKATAAA